MTDKINKVISGETTLDEISVTELEGLIADFPFADTFKVLLAKKMGKVISHSLALQNNDMVMAGFNDFGELAPQGENLQIFLEKTDQKEEPKELTETDMLLNQEILVENSMEEVDNTTDNNAQEGMIEPSNEIIVEIDENVIDESVIDDNGVVLTDESNEKTTENVDSDDLYIDTIDGKPKDKDKKSKKNKKDKFALKEYSGISDFSKWLLAFKKEDVEKKIKKEEKAARKRIIEENARKSVTKSATIISESLAIILASQGHLDDAKKMYEQLMHKYPEKSSYFAAKINNLINI